MAAVTTPIKQKEHGGQILPIPVPPELSYLWQRNPEIVKYGDPVLRQVARPVPKFTREVAQLIERMGRIMRAAPGVGLAAPQIGLLQRVILYQLPEEGSVLHALVNPKIVSRSGEQIGQEGCLSIPALQGDVSRAKEIVVKGLDQHGRAVRRRATDFEARVIQHEIDHLDGILFIDTVLPETLHFIFPDDESSNSPVE